MATSHTVKATTVDQATGRFLQKMTENSRQHSLSPARLACANCLAEQEHLVAVQKIQRPDAPAVQAADLAALKTSLDAIGERYHRLLKDALNSDVRGRLEAELHSEIGMARTLWRNKHGQL